MKRTRSVLALVLCAALLLCSGCGAVVSKSADKTDGPEKSLYEHGMDVVDGVREISTHPELFGAQQELTETVKSVSRGDYSEPSAVYKIYTENSEETAEKFCEFMGVPFSDGLREYIETRMFSSMVSQMNSALGATYIAAAGICTANKLFVSRELESNMQYIYVFENAYPVAVSFTLGEDNAVYAAGTVLFYTDIIDVLNGGENESHMDEIFKETGIKIEKIK